MLVHIELTDSAVLREVRWESDSADYTDYEDAPEKGMLSVTFTNGSTYNYSRVPLWRVSEMLMADSRGSFFAKHIRDNYRHERVA